MDLKQLNIILPVILVSLSACGGGGNSAQDPLVDGFPIAYVKRPFPLLDAENNNQVIQPDARDPLQFYSGSDLYIRDHASAQANERNVTSSFTGGTGDVKDVAVSYDGKKLLFAMKEADIDGALPEDQPTWNIWEYNIETGRLRRIIELDMFAEEGHDIAPHYLPDGRIIFSSSRQYGLKETHTNEGKGRYTSLVDQENVHAMMLHVMNVDGSDIRQITYGLGIDMDPYVRRDGRVIFSRWDRSGGLDGINIYSVNPDGTDLQLLYGAHSHFGISIRQFTQIREYPDGRVLSILRPYSNTFGGGDIGLIDTDRFADYGRPTKNHVGISGTGQESLTGGEASANVRPLLGGRYISVFPLWDGSGRSLVSWTPCRIVEGGQNVSCTEDALANPDVVEAEPVYSLYVYDPAQNVKLPVFLPKAGEAITDVVAAQPRAYPRQLGDSVANSNEKTGILHIRSVYDYDGNFDDRGANITIPDTDTDNPIPYFFQNTQPDNRTARFIRLIKPFVRPARNDLIPNVAFGRNSNFHGLMEIIGYAPIEPDGSVKVRVPANTPFSFQIVDEDGRRIDEQRHSYWLSVRNGEMLECGGCHNHDNGMPHGRRDAVEAINRGAAQDGPFPGQSASLEALAGETMAETRTRISCETDCNGLNPTVDIVYDDIWSLTPVDSFAYSYNDIFDFATDETPVTQNCVTTWIAECRMVINYVTHIDPLWSKPRVNTTTGDDATCSRSTCHSPVDDAGSPQVPDPSFDLPPDSDSPRRVPAVTGSQLNLDNISIFDPDDDPDRLEAYRELLFNDNIQEIVDGALVDAIFDGASIFDPITEEFIGYEQINSTTRPGRPMVQGNANTSRFFNVFSDIANVTHYDTDAGQAILSRAELKLISEWLDIGGQYYNDPFAVPPN